MAYLTRAQIEAKVPAPVLNDALDDDGSGDPAAATVVLAQIIQNASDTVDAYLAGLFGVPFADPVPAKVHAAAFIFALEDIYSRRNVPDQQNPFSSQAKWWRDHLQKVGNRELPMDAAVDKAFVPGAAITEDVSINAQTT